MELVSPDPSGGSPLRSGAIRGEARSAFSEGSLDLSLLQKKAGFSDKGKSGLIIDPLDKGRASDFAKTMASGEKSPNPSLIRGVQAAFRSAQAMGFPKDTLTAYILSFARAFSLKIDMPLFQRLRSALMRSSRDEKDAALAAVLAASKGAELSASGIDSFVSALDGDASGDHGAKSQTPHHDSSHHESKEDENSIPTSEALAVQEAFYSFQDNSEVFSILNKLKDRDGRRWLVFPLTQNDSDVEIHALVRILLVPGDKSVERLIVELNTRKRFWSFSAVHLGQPGAVMRIAADPPLLMAPRTMLPA